jgi:hypothetical protein
MRYDYSESQAEFIPVSANLLQLTEQLQGDLSLWLAEIHRARSASGNVLRFPSQLNERAQSTHDAIESVFITGKQ